MTHVLFPCVRYLSQKKYPELLDLLRSGTDKLLEHGQQSSGADLAILFVEVLKKSGVTPDESKLLTLASFFDKMKPDLPEREVRSVVYVMHIQLCVLDVFK